VKVAVLGVGLIGGSIGLAARRAGAHVVGYDRVASVLSSALALGAVDEAVPELSGAVRQADVVFVATPVGASVQTARLALEVAGGQCVVSDVGSTKREIVQAISDPRFVGGHPLAGAETAGVENARADLFDGAVWYLTAPAVEPVAGASSSPSSETSSPPARSAPPLPRAVSDSATGPPAAGAVRSPAMDRLTDLVERFGARAVNIDPVAHDRLMANVSHLPHVFANLLVDQAAQTLESLLSSEGEVSAALLGAGPSFRDATRVAGANTAIWTDIYMTNRDVLATAIDLAMGRLGKVRSALADGDSAALTSWNESARDAREQLERAGLASDS
jgi:prephenate dehydrogenase